MAAWYRDDLAFIHHAGYGHFARTAAETLLATLRDRDFRSGTVADLGCGSGILSAIVSQAGFDVVGYGISPAMLRLARAQAPRARLVKKSFIDAKLPQCIAIAAIGEIFSFQLDENNTPANFAGTLQRIYETLLPGGVLLFDMVGRGRAGPTGKRAGYTATDDWVCCFTETEDVAQEILTRDIVSFRRAGKYYRREEERHVLRIVEPSEVTQQLRRAGFHVKRLETYAGLPRYDGLACFLATKSR